MDGGTDGGRMVHLLRVCNRVSPEYRRPPLFRRLARGLAGLRQRTQRPVARARGLWGLGQAEVREGRAPPTGYGALRAGADSCSNFHSHWFQTAAQVCVLWPWVCSLTGISTKRPCLTLGISAFITILSSPTGFT